ncbi:MAG: 3-hydroxybutyryl-CoA dehydrogenase, partial [Candidatus Dadabacteria bacterium]
MAVERVGVVGCGLMGSGIAEVTARAGLDVVVHERNEECLASGRARIERSLERAVKASKISSAEAEAALGRITFTCDLGAMADRQLVVEAVFEDEAVKTEVFRQLDRIVEDERAILASNTSSIPIMKLGVVTQRPSQVCGLHFFNPVPVLNLVEL